jgi:hypothetical protein
MEQIIVRGVSASGLIGAISGLGAEIKSIEIDVPLNEVGTSDPSVTLSGSLTGAYTFHSDTTLDLRYGTENIYITTDSFGAEYSAIIRYVRYGSQTQAMLQKDNSKWALPSRLTRRTPRSS